MADSTRPTYPSDGSDFLQLDPALAPPKGITGWLVDAIRTAVADERLPAGSTLPSTRTLADDLGISRGVIVDAYRRLADEGLVGAYGGGGTRVLPRPGVSTAPRPVAVEPMQLPSMRLPSMRLPRPPSHGIDLSPGVPDLSAFPRAAWLRAERIALGNASAADLGYGDPRGHPWLRRELAGWLARLRGLRTHPDDVIVVAGVAQSLALLCQVLRAAGETTIAVEEPGSRGARDEIVHWGLIPEPVPVDDQGMCVDDLIASGIRNVVLTPAHQFPTGVVLAPHRRRALLEWAGLIIEDDYDAEYRYDRAPVPALQASAPDRIAYTGSTSKTLSPGLRLGWLIPPPRLSADLVAAKHASDLGCSVIPQLTLAQLLAGGEYDRHIRLVRARQRRRRDALLTAIRSFLPQAHVQGIAAGLHLLITLPGEHDDVELAEKIGAAGVVVHPLSWHRQRPGRPGFVLGYAANPPDRLTEAARVIARVVGG